MVGVIREMNVPSTGERSGIRNVLLGPPIQEVLSQVEDKCCDRQNHHECAGKEHEDLPALVGPWISC